MSDLLRTSPQYHRGELFLNGVKEAIQRELEQEFDAVLAAAQAEAMKRCRAKLGTIVAGLFNSYDFVADRHRLVITVNIKDIRGGGDESASTS